MAPGTELQRRRTLDLTRAPDEQWNAEMVQLVSSQVLKRAATKGEQYYCLAVADSLELNPFIDEIYFLPSKSTDGSGPGIKPYIGRNGLVKKANDRGAYFEAEVVCANDKFHVVRRKDGSREVTHSYGHEDQRGGIVGAYAFLHFRNGDRPAYAYAKLSEYLPTFDADWKMEKSPWGERNQRTAMIKKCAMIVAGRERLQLGNVLSDGEIERVTQQELAGPPRAPAPQTVADAEFDWLALEGDRVIIDRLRAAVFATNDLRPGTWTPAKLQMTLTGMSNDELLMMAQRIEVELEVTDAEVLPDLTPEQIERRDMLQGRIADLQLQHRAAETDEDHDLLDEEIAKVGAELAALGDAGQETML